MKKTQERGVILTIGTGWQPYTIWRRIKMRVVNWLVAPLMRFHWEE